MIQEGANMAEGYLRHAANLDLLNVAVTSNKGNHDRGEGRGLDDVAK